MSKEINPFEKYDQLFDEQDKRFNREDKKQFKSAKKLEPLISQRPSSYSQIITTIVWILVFTFVAPRIFINFRFFGFLVVSFTFYLVYLIIKANKIK
jgi:hypothetical protein